MQAVNINLWLPEPIEIDPQKPKQRWVNIVGSVRLLSAHKQVRMVAVHPDGTEEPVPLGPDGYRLVANRDFNVEVDRSVIPATGYTIQLQVYSSDNASTLLAGRQVRIVPVKRDGRAVADGADTNRCAPSTHNKARYVAATQADVGGQYDAAIQHGTAARHEVGPPEVVDGQWHKTQAGYRNGDIGFDRLLAFGDTAMENYRVTTTITIHRFNTDHPAYPDIGPGAGLLLRWQGHSAENTERPRRQWRPVGAICWYRYGRDQADTVRDYRLQILGGRLGHGIVSEPIAEDTSGRSLSLGKPYVFEAEVDGRRTNPAQYRFRVRPPQLIHVTDATGAAGATRLPTAGNAGPVFVQDLTRDCSWDSTLWDPTWDLIGRGLPGEQPTGSVLVVAHHAEITVRDVCITPLI